MGDMPCGLCGVCDEEVDHSEAGFCGECGQPFHWGQCGGWGSTEHVCNSCRVNDDAEV